MISNCGVHRAGRHNSLPWIELISVIACVHTDLHCILRLCPCTVQCSVSIQLNTRATSITCCGDGRHLAIGDVDGVVWVYDMRTPSVAQLRLTCGVNAPIGHVTWNVKAGSNTATTSRTAASSTTRPALPESRFNDAVSTIPSDDSFHASNDTSSELYEVAKIRASHRPAETLATGIRRTNSSNLGDQSFLPKPAIARQGAIASSDVLHATRPIIFERQTTSRRACLRIQTLRTDVNSLQIHA